jgi:hypothetical protein
LKNRAVLVLFVSLFWVSCRSVPKGTPVSERAIEAAEVAAAAYSGATVTPVFPSAASSAYSRTGSYRIEVSISGLMSCPKYVPQDLYVEISDPVYLKKVIATGNLSKHWAAVLFADLLVGQQYLVSLKNVKTSISIVQSSQKHQGQAPWKIMLEGVCHSEK